MLRKRVLAIAAAACLFGLAGCQGGVGASQGQAKPALAVQQAPPSTQPAAHAPAKDATPSPEVSLAALKEGNERFVQGRFAAKDLSAAARQALVAGQHPFAVIVCCSDSRVPPELVFDQALGQIFVVRVAGNVIDPVVLGSVEYGTEHLHAPLVVVLGHEGCGAVQAAIEGGQAPGSIGSIVERIQPSVGKAAARHLTGPAEQDLVIQLNIAAAVRQIMASPVIAHLLKADKVKVVGAKYHLASGEVEWLANSPAPAQRGPTTRPRRRMATTTTAPARRRPADAASAAQ